MCHASRRTKILASLFFSTLAVLGSRPARAAAPQDYEKYTPTPPRLSYAEGEVSFWRPGAEDWSQARVNTPLAAGDALYTGPEGNLEVEIGARAFIRAGEQTQISIANLEPDFLQVEVKGGRASIDLRTVPPGHTVEIDTPNAAFTIENSGYYRVDVDEDTTTFTTRRGGRATVTPAAGNTAAIASSETVVVQGNDTLNVETYMAPDMDDWDRWNYTRTDRIIDSMSARYVSPDVYGTDDLDYYGRWRVVPTYGSVWVPSGVAQGWAPYSTGRWIMDPYYGWTWVDDAPWGWAPYHYGRWVFVDGYWAWAPGPVVVQPAYAPALVAFFGGFETGGFSFGFSSGGPAIGWVALGWGEPCHPWWGPGYFRYQPWWGGWGGPHRHGWWDDHDHGHWGHDHDHGDHDHDHGHWDNGHDGDHDHDGHDSRPIGRGREVDGYANARVPRGIVAVGEKGFGRGQSKPVQVSERDLKSARRIEDLPRPDRTSVMPASGGGRRPPEETSTRPVVATRKPSDPAAALQPIGLTPNGRGFSGPTKIVEAPKRGAVARASLPRAPFGTRTGAEREEPPAPPPYRGQRGASVDHGRSPSRGDDSSPSGSAGRSASRERQSDDASRGGGSNGAPSPSGSPRGWSSGASSRGGVSGKPQQRPTPPSPGRMSVPPPVTRARSYDGGGESGASDTRSSSPQRSRTYGGGASRSVEPRGYSTRTAPERGVYAAPSSGGTMRNDSGSRGYSPSQPSSASHGNTRAPQTYGREQHGSPSYGGQSSGGGQSYGGDHGGSQSRGHAQSRSSASLPGEPANRVYGGRGAGGMASGGGDAGGGIGGGMGGGGGRWGR